MPLHHLASPQKQICSIKLDADNRPIALIGRINVTVTTGREAAPSPSSGFVTDYTPFDRGHIMALELGGPDISQNIVPQYAQWQETGTWRRMETALAVSTNKGGVFAVKMSYAAHPDTYSAQQTRFSCNEVFDWQDKRIPDRFIVWCIPASDPLVAQIDRILLNNSAAREAEFNTCFTAIEKTASSHDLDHSKMPDEDSWYWRQQHIGFAVASAYSTYSTERNQDIQGMESDVSTNPPTGFKPKEISEAVSLTRSPLRDEVEFAMTQQSTVRKELETEWGWSSTDTAALTGSDILDSYYDRKRKTTVKKEWEKHMGYKKKYKDQRAKYKTYQGRGFAYKKGVGYRGNKTDITAPNK
ncbi:MAG: DNA/RNA non-specific endonuclease [Methylococcaceae bacterium]|nr:DNA/RNA non-specific endonuclease [Methylococcaceae bacterium]